MSLNDPKKIISLMSELCELLESWNINISDDNDHTLRLKLEDVSAVDNADNEYSFANAIADQDYTSISKSKEKSETLLNRCRMILSEVQPILEQANLRVTNGVKVFNIWKTNANDSREWLNTAQKEYNRAVSEYNNAVNDYNRSLPALERAEKSLNNCRSRQTRDKNGNVTPSCNYERKEYEERLHITMELKAIMEEKHEVMEKAKAQLEMAKEAFDIASQVSKESQILLEKSRELLELSNSSHKNANDAISAASSALELDKLAEKDNSVQREYNAESLIQKNKIKSAISSVYSSVNSIMDLSDSCERLSAMMRSDMESKSVLMYRFAGLHPDVITIKNR